MLKSSKYGTNYVKAQQQQQQQSVVITSSSQQVTHQPYHTYVYQVCMSIPLLLIFFPFRTAVPFWGQTTQNLSGFSPKRDCTSKRVKARKKKKTRHSLRSLLGFFTPHYHQSRHTKHEKHTRGSRSAAWYRVQATNIAITPPIEPCELCASSPRFYVTCP